jgi:hypothetical protein
MLGAALALGGCAAPGVGPEDDVVAREEAIKGGTDDAKDTAVVAFVNLVDGSLCSGSLIAPNLVLTARHCVSNVLDTVNGGVDCAKTRFDAISDANHLFVTTAAVVKAGNVGEFRVHEVIGLPAERHFVCGDDVALLVLEGKADPTKVTPYEPRVATPLAKGDAYTAIGYGATDDGSTGGGTRRVRSGLTVACVGKDCDPTNVTANEWTGETGICHGDSGGPAVDADGRVAGVVSRGKLGCDAPIYSHVFSFADWIKDVGVLAAGFGEYDPPDWTAGSKESPQHGMPVGDTCTKDAECWSQHCVLPAGYCSRECDDTAKCPADYQCSTDAPRLCIDPQAKAAPTKSSYGTSPGRDDSSSCATAPGRGAAGGLGATMIAAALGALARRRARRPLATRPPRP